MKETEDGLSTGEELSQVEDSNENGVNAQETTQRRHPVAEREQRLLQMYKNKLEGLRKEREDTAKKGDVVFDSRLQEEERRLAARIRSLESNLT